ncbi:MAG: IS200/IS605 family transposase [Candidatus Korobacteraceae bacterium]
MAHTYISISYHLVFSTKGRLSTIPEPQKLWAYVAGVAKNLNYRSLAIGGTRNHIHILAGVPPIISAAQAVQELKANSSRWLRENGKWQGWQEGYGAFSVSASNIDAVRHYIQNQEAHHRKQSYEEEFLSFLDRSGASYDKNEVFD